MLFVTNLNGRGEQLYYTALESKEEKMQFEDGPVFS